MRGHLIRRCFAAASFIAAAALLAAPPAGAQEGAVTGTVTDAASGEPLDAAQVLVVGTGLGTITDADGTYRITGVPAGEQRVQVQLLGYSSRTRTVEVQSGQAATLDFELRQSAVELEQIVVTGTGTGGIQQKKLGNTIGTIDASQIENAPTTSVTEMLTAREPGLQVLSASGMTNEGAKIRIRGASSLSQSNEPLIYIDGVRINSGGDFAGPADAGGLGTGASSRLDDLNPNAIARVEVLKGAAAATLYGTEASNGVIQIFTKTGREGETRWNFEFEQGAEFMPTNRLVPLADHATTQGELQTLKERWGAPSDLELYETFQTDQPFRDFAETGRLTNAGGSVSGGSQGITYFASGRYSNIDGIVGFEDLGPARDKSERWQAAANLNTFPAEDVRLSLSSNYSFVQQQTPTSSNSTLSTWAQMSIIQLRLANCQDHSQACNYYGVPFFATPEETMQRQTGQEVNHFRTSLQTQYQASQAVALNATVGMDVVSNDSWEQTPFGWDVDNFTPTNVNGTRDIGTQNDVEFTTELRAGWDAELGDQFTSNLTVGTQGFLRQSRLRGGTGTGFGGPGLEVAGAANQLSLTESITENVNIGTFAQEQIGYRDFVYLTLGGRYDVNSAFGQETQGEFYPKASASLVLSDLDEWDSETFSTLRLRGAWGESGLQPNSFAKFRTFSGIGSVTGPGVEPQNLGNPELRPEVSTEYEAGLELGVLNDRISFEGTWWTRTVNDALVQRQFAVSGGFLQPQLVNIARLDAHGFDLNVNGRAISGDDFSLNVFANAAYLNQTVTDLGGAPAIKTGGAYPRNRNFLKEGLPPGAFLGARLDSDAEIPLDLTDSCEAPSRSEALAFFSQPRSTFDFEVLPEDCGSGDVLQNFLGSPWPDWSGSLGFDMSFLGNFTFRTMAEYRLGQQHQDLSGAFRRALDRNTPLSDQVQATLANPNSSAEQRLQAAQTWARELRGLSPMSGMNQIYDASFLRWREASLTYRAPQSLASSFSMRTLSFSFRARNVALWVADEYRGLDPELNSGARCGGAGQPTSVDCNFLMGQEAWRIPIPRRFTLSVSAGF